MRMRVGTWVAALLALAGTWTVPSAQEAEDRTLLSWAQMRGIIDEASGERAMQHVRELVPYPRVRPRSEYLGQFRETTVMAERARAYGYSTVDVESFPSPSPLYQAARGELWLVEPQPRKLYDIHDVAVSLAANSASGEVTAEVIDVGTGARAEDFSGKDVEGRIVLGSAPVNVLQRLGVFERGAAGVIGYTSLRSDDEPDQVLSQSLGTTPPEGAGVGFGWAVSPRVGRELAARIASGERVVVRSVIEAEQFPGELELVHATIAGDGSSDQVVFVSAHLYEGYIKQGANDDSSGCALTLEMGRAYIELVKSGALPRPKRTIHFLWVPEISGTSAWLDEHPEVAGKAIADLNFDMEGLGLAQSRSFWVLHRTPDTLPSFLNDVAQSFMEFVAELNRERLRYRGNGYEFTWPIVSPNGSRDPFYIKIDKHYGSSDHVTYMQRGIPSIMLITWPDMWYHSSRDTPDRLDPTQFRRAAVVGIGTMATLAGADDALAGRVAAEALGRGAARVGEAQRKGLAYLADATDPPALTAAFKEARVALRHQVAVEKAVVASSAVLFGDPASAEGALAGFDAIAGRRAAVALDEIEAFYGLAAARHGVQPTEPVMTEHEREASRLVAERIEQAGDRRPAVARARIPSIPQHMTAELEVLLERGRTVLEIRDFLSGEFEPLPLEDLMAHLRAREEAGSVRLVERP